MQAAQITKTKTSSKAIMISSWGKFPGMSAVRKGPISNSPLALEYKHELSIKVSLLEKKNKQKKPTKMLHGAQSQTSFNISHIKTSEEKDISYNKSLTLWMCDVNLNR